MSQEQEEQEEQVEQEEPTPSLGQKDWPYMSEI